MATAPHLAAPAWRREPYRLLFPLGAALAVVAVLPFALGGAAGGALALFHSVAQIQGFLTCFIVGFLYTFVPRRTQTRAPAPWQMVAALGLPAASVASAWADDRALAHGLWLALMAIVLDFTLRRLGTARATQRVPAVFLWVPISILAGGTGAVLTAVAPLIEPGAGPKVWAIGRGLLVQGLVAGLVVGVGCVLIPQLTRGEASLAEIEAPPHHRRRLALHALGAALFFASFPIEVLEDLRLGAALRALVAGCMLLAVARIHRLPNVPGLNRRLIWAAAWLVPLGFSMEALWPRFRGAALHVVFVGGFAQLTLAVAIHVALSHGGRPERLDGSPPTLRAMSALLATAFAARILAGIDLGRVAAWLAVAGLAFCGAVMAWAALVVPALLPGAPGAAGSTGRG
jgi:uncharacterized protein involved in response to NO